MFSELKDVSRTLIINAGHWDDPHTPGVEDPGASHNHITEAVECMKIRDALVPILLERGYTVHEVPDELNLRESIAWANEKAPNLNDALAVDIHLNYLSNKEARGVESFHGTSEKSIKIATALAAGVAGGLGIPNRGAKPDTQTYVGSLGWIRKTTMWASLIEVCFLSNTEDIEALRAPDGYMKAATGIANSIDHLYGQESPPENPLKDIPTMKLIEELQRRIRDKEL